MHVHDQNFKIQSVSIAKEVNKRRTHLYAASPVPTEHESIVTKKIS